MIVCHSRRFIFLAVPKTGTQSIRAALRPHLDPVRDWEQSDWQASRRLPIDALARIGHGHIRAVEAQPWLPAEAWSGYFKFAFVRNPWDRFISCAFFRNAHRPLFQAYPQRYLPLLLESERTRADTWFAAQQSFLIDAVGRLSLDFIGRFERLQDDFDHVCRRLGLPSGPLPQLNASTHEAAASYYTDDLAAKVAVTYREDIEAFGYAGHEPGRGPTHLRA